MKRAFLFVLFVCFGCFYPHLVVCSEEGVEKTAGSDEKLDASKSEASERGESSVFDDIYFPVGINLGSSLSKENSFILGAEASMAYVPERGAAWTGLYVDWLWDFGLDGFRYSAGCELGVWFFGVEVGFVGEVSDSMHRYGVRGGGFLSLFGLVSTYARIGRLNEANNEEEKKDWMEVGVLLKYTFGLDRQFRKER